MLSKIFDWLMLGSGVFRRILVSILIVSLVPLALLGGLAIYTANESGKTATGSSRAALDTKGAEALELRAQDAARAAALFLEDREGDLRTLALLPRSPETYQDFYQIHTGDLLFLEDGSDVLQSIPLYQEISFLDPDGQEVIRVLDGRLVASEELRDLSDPSATTYKSETYFVVARQLDPGEIYVSHVTGFYVDQTGFEAGARFEGLLRFAMPVHSPQGELEGIIVLSLDVRHLQAFTAYVIPTQERYGALPDPTTGNYAYMIDDRGYPIDHPYDYQIFGLDSQGQPMPYAESDADFGNLPINLPNLGFADENLPQLHNYAMQGNSGSIQYTWDEHDKFVAYAPILYFGGTYSAPGGFGWVAIGADVETFHEAANTLNLAFDESLQTTVRNTGVVVVVAALAVVFTAGFLARLITGGLHTVTEAAVIVEAGEFTPEDLEDLAKLAELTDELGQLARVFQRMARNVLLREKRANLLKVIIPIGVALSAERDFNRLMETILLEAKKLTNADSGTLYLRTEDELKFVIVRNDLLDIAMGGTTDTPVTFPTLPLYNEDGQPNHHNIATYTALTNQPVYIEDAYHAEGFDFSGTRRFDEHTGYRSKSFLTMPLQGAEEQVIGVLQLINALDPYTGEVIPFEKDDVVDSLVLLASAALQGYIREQELRQQLAQLRIQVDETKRKAQVEEIVETDFFRYLKEKAKALRQRRSQSDAKKASDESDA